MSTIKHEHFVGSDRYGEIADTVSSRTI